LSVHGGTESRFPVVVRPFPASVGDRVSCGLLAILYADDGLHVAVEALALSRGAAREVARDLIQRLVPIGLQRNESRL
jgi:hypothetical protein